MISAARPGARAVICSLISELYQYLNGEPASAAARRRVTRRGPHSYARNKDFLRETIRTGQQFGLNAGRLWRPARYARRGALAANGRNSIECHLSLNESESSPLIWGNGIFRCASEPMSGVPLAILSERKLIVGRERRALRPASRSAQC
ncbi:hypothetical protein EVAR_103207_1 [Eumeta japonica]|uniref:Uncharacterized protein n=1 Tax=Eumeta variegata TaxID=151549 RepID=A0A4C2A161_EUMVA|nr:hypothetical protein EVAR_103207_1 [Eumeta japonica]